MTQPAILAKLMRALRSDVATECEVVYVLAEIRKFIEQAGTQQSYYALDLYCSWALHTTMSRAGAAKILKRFDEAHPILVRGDDLPADLQHEIEETTKLTTFRRQLKEFLAEHDLPRGIVKTADSWARFVCLYGGVIDDCDLVVKDERLVLKHIDRVSVHLERARKPLPKEYGDEVFFRITWTCHGKDGGSGDHDVYFSFSEARIRRVAHPLPGGDES